MKRFRASATSASTCAASGCRGSAASTARAARSAAGKSDRPTASIACAINSRAPDFAAAARPAASSAPWHSLYRRPLPQGQGALRDAGGFIVDRFPLSGNRGERCFEIPRESRHVEERRGLPVRGEALAEFREVLRVACERERACLVFAEACGNEI